MGFFLDIYLEYFVRVIIRFFKGWNARSWNIVTAEVTDTNYRRGGIGCAVADVSYKYEIDGQFYTGTNSVPFISNGSAKDYVAHYSPTNQLLIRVRTEDPASSIVREADLYRVEHGFRLETK
jgi:uncharacterized protein DUF3592